MFKQFVLLATLFFILTQASADEGKPSTRDSLRSVLPINLDTNRVIILNKLSFEYMLVSSLDSASAYGKMAFDLSTQLSYKKGSAKSLINLGNVFLAQSRYEEAKRNFLDALELASDIKNDLVASHSLNNLGETSRIQGNYDDALNYYLKALRIDERSADKMELAGSLNNIGLLYGEIGENKKAISFLEQSLALSREVNNPRYVSVNLTNLADYNNLIGNRQTALLYFAEALGMKRAFREPSGEAICLLGMGNVFLDSGNVQTAREYFIDALKISKSIGDREIEGSCLNNLGVINAREGELQKAIAFHKSYLALALSLGAKKDIRNAYLSLSSDYQFMHDYKNAYAYHKLYSTASDSLFNSQRQRAITDAESRYAMEKKSFEIAVLKKEQELQLRLGRNQKLMMGGGIVLTIALGFVFYFRAEVSRQQSNRLTDQVDAQNRELSTVALLVNKKNQAFNNLRAKLVAIREGPQEGQIIHSLIKDIDKEVNFDVEWDTFKYHFEKVHPGFFARLQEVAPSLGDKELRFCAYVKSNLTTKEIARLTGTTARSVQQTRYRINLKFGSGETLSHFLRKI